MLEINLNTSTHNDKAYEQMNASFGADTLLYQTLKDKLQTSSISEQLLMEWSRFVKLASEDAVSINELEEFAVIKILRSWKSIEGIIVSNQPNQ